MTVCGYVYFLDSEDTPRPFVNSTVEIWEKDVLFDDYLGSTTTNSSGYFSKRVSGSDTWPDQMIEPYLQFKAKNSRVKVYEPISAEPYRWFSSSKSTSGGNVNFGTWQISSGSRGACSIFHWMNESWNFTATRGYDPGEIIALWPYGGSSQYHHVCPAHANDYGAIYIKNSHWYWSTEDATRHEYGHALMHHAQNLWWAPNSCEGSDDLSKIIHQENAWVEGWAHAYAQFVDSDGMNNWWLHIQYPENNTFNLPNGWSEVRVGAAVSDLFDSNVDGDDYSSISYSKIISTLRSYNNNHLIEFWNNLKPTLSESEKHYGSRALRYNTFDVPFRTGSSRTLPQMPFKATHRKRFRRVCYFTKHS